MAEDVASCRCLPPLTGRIQGGGFHKEFGRWFERDVATEIDAARRVEACRRVAQVCDNTVRDLPSEQVSHHALRTKKRRCPQG